MSELAFNINGEAFELPATATGWRVRRMKHKGAPEVVYGRDGLPLVLPIEAELDDLRTNVDTTGRYRLDPVDDNYKPIANSQSAYVYVNTSGAAAIAAVTGPTAPHSDSVVIEAMRMNAEIARSVIDRFPQMVEAAATLLRAADGAGIPARTPRIDGDDDGDDDGTDDARPPGFDLNALVAQVVPMLVMGLSKGNGKVPGLGEMLDWRKATPAAKQHPKAPKAGKPAEDVEDAAVPENATDVLPPIDPQTMAHFVAVQSVLTPEESAIAREVAKELSATELRAWFDELGALSVPDAVAKVRKLISGFGKTGGAS
jgi:hypothetical protein